MAAEAGSKVGDAAQRGDVAAASGGARPQGEPAIGVPATRGAHHLGAVARGTWRHRLFAWAMSRPSRDHEWESWTRRRQLVGALRGTVVEIGPGAGRNLELLADDVRWIGIEPNVHMHRHLHRRASHLGRSIDVRVGIGEKMPVADASVDAVIATFVLCSVDCVDAVLGEVRRVLRPGGRLVFVEHVAAPRGTWTFRLQRLVRPVWSALGDGCHPDRETDGAIGRAGFDRLEIEAFEVPLFGGLRIPFIAGAAEVAGAADGLAAEVAGVADEMAPEATPTS